MKYKILTITLLILMTAVVSSAQTSYKGIKPGTSRKVEVERVLGQPVKQLSETLVEYRPQPLAGRIYVQYRAASGIVERIEFICRLPDSSCNDFMQSLNLRLPESAQAMSPTDDKGRYLAFSAPPHYAVETFDKGVKENDLLVPVRVAFYSRELYEAEVAKANKASEGETATTKKEPTPDRGGIAPITGATIGGGVLNGRALALPQPAYPAIARATHASGTVTVQVVVDEEGNVISARAVSGHALLQAASVAAARNAKFPPTLSEGKPVKVTGVITYNFDEIN
jgi:TonB family protein